MELDGGGKQTERGERRVRWVGQFQDVVVEHRRRVFRSPLKESINATRAVQFISRPAARRPSGMGRPFTHG